MSAYLADRLAANKKVRIRYRTEVIGVRGFEHIDGVRIRDAEGELRDESTSGLFVFIGARPRTDFLPAGIAKDANGFLLTGSDIAADRDRWHQARPPATVETNLPGVYAAGDCRHGSAKRVAFLDRRRCLGRRCRTRLPRALGPGTQQTRGTTCCSGSRSHESALTAT
jgi:thioredoxin reductase (NADPH)